MENEKIKTSRASQTRSKTESKKVWTPPTSLDAPPAPKGYRHQWIRAEILDQDFPSMNEGRYAGMIGVGGLLLARIPEEIALQIDEYYKKQTLNKEEAVNNNLMKEQHPSMRFSKEADTRVTFGGTKKS